jgi:hypothetical protein
VGVAPGAQAARSPTATVRLLLLAYADTLDVIDGLPVAPMVATGWHWWSRPDAPIRLPRVRWMLRSLTLWHIERVLAGAERVFRRRAALGIAAPGEADALGAVTDFRASLQSRSRVLRVAVLAIAALVLARVIATLLSHLGTHGRLTTPTAAERLFDNALHALLEPGSFGSEVTALSNAPLIGLVLDGLLLGVCLYLIFRLVAGTFRLKRLLLNLYPHADSMRGSTPATWSVSRSTGVYRLERETFAAFGAHVPGEPPLDLLASLAPPIIWVTLCLAVTLSASAGYTFWNQFAAVAFILIIFCTPAVIRLAWLAAAWRARNGRPRSTWLFADEVSVPWSSKPVRCRSPVLICWLSLIVPLLYVIAWWPWWSTAHDLRELGRAYDVKYLRDMHPVAQALALSPAALLLGGLPALIVLLRAPRYIREAQAATGLGRQANRHLAWLAPLWPILCVLLQRELNRLWQAQRMRIGPHAPGTDLPRTIDTTTKTRSMASDASRKTTGGRGRRQN